LDSWEDRGSNGHDQVLKMLALRMLYFEDLSVGIK
jgi:hypothetical protein